MVPIFHGTQCSLTPIWGELTGFAGLGDKKARRACTFNKPLWFINEMGV
jgi:hypothetical protein